MITNPKFHLASAGDLIVWRLRGKNALDFLFLRKNETCFYTVSDDRVTRFTVAAPGGPMVVIKDLFEAADLERRLLEVETSPTVSEAQVLASFPEWVTHARLVEITTPEAAAAIYAEPVQTLATLEF